jgi:hypothetical protein
MLTVPSEAHIRTNSLPRAHCFELQASGYSQLACKLRHSLHVRSALDVVPGHGFTVQRIFNGRASPSMSLSPWMSSNSPL